MIFPLRATGVVRVNRSDPDAFAAVLAALLREVGMADVVDGDRSVRFRSGTFSTRPERAPQMVRGIYSCQLSLEQEGARTAIKYTLGFEWAAALFLAFVLIVLFMIFSQQAPGESAVGPAVAGLVIYSAAFSAGVLTTKVGIEDLIYRAASAARPAEVRPMVDRAVLRSVRLTEWVVMAAFAFIIAVAVLALVLKAINR